MGGSVVSRRSSFASSTPFKLPALDMLLKNLHSAIYDTHRGGICSWRNKLWFLTRLVGSLAFTIVILSSTTVGVALGAFEERACILLVAWFSTIVTGDARTSIVYWSLTQICTKVRGSCLGIPIVTFWWPSNVSFNNLVQVFTLSKL